MTKLLNNINFIIKGDGIFFGFCMFIFFSIFNTSKFGASLSWIILPVIVVFLAALLNRKLNIKKNSLLIFMFWTIYFISTSISPYTNIESNIITFFCFCIFYILITSKKYTNKELKFAINLYVILAIICSINILYNYMTKNFYNEWFQRASFYFGGVYKDPNYVMAYVVPGMFFMYLKLINTSKLKNKYLYTFGIIILVLAILATGSRSAILNSIIAVLISYIFLDKISIKKKLKIIAVIGIGAFILYFFLNNFYSTQALNRLINFTQDSRESLWDAALNVFFERPVLGGGFGSANIFSFAKIGNASHNVYLDILCDSGAIGMLSFLIFFFSNCFNITTKYKSSMYGMCISFMLPMFFINGFNTATFYLALIIITIFNNYYNSNKDMPYEIFD